MSTKRLEHLKEWDKIYFPIERKLNNQDDEISLCFQSELWEQYWFNDNDTFYTLADLKQLANDGIPKQGELEFWDEVEVSLDWEKWYSRDDTTYQFTFISKVKDKYIISKANNIIDKFEKELYVDWIRFYKYCRKHTKKTELTLAQVEEKLGLDVWSLLIKD